jgi:Uma2 family endonuclease
LIIDPHIEQRLRAERAASGADRFDEVWEGIYMMAPMPNIEHQRMVNRFAAIFQEVIDWPELGIVQPGCNVSDREDGWENNYRIPDVAVFLQEGTARNCNTHWCGGPDFLIEVVSRDDKSREKLRFYAQVGAREVLLVDRDPWHLRLFQLHADQLELAAESSMEKNEPLPSDVLPFTFQLVAGLPRPQIVVRHTGTGKLWLV